MHAPPPESRASFQNYALATLGLLAAGVIAAVSMALNYRFGLSLGRSPEDGLIYAAASVAADALKILTPFFFFAAVRNRMWSQASAAALVWVVVTGYAIVGAFGHAALNRVDTAGKRSVESTQYADLRAEHKRTSELLSWIPQHRPTATIEAEIASQKTARMFLLTNGCAPSSVQSTGARTFCADLHKLEAERASSIEGARLQSRLDEINTKLAPIATAPQSADPQVSILSNLTGIGSDKVTGFLVVLLVVLIEVGAGLGPYVAMSHFPDKPRGSKRKAPETAFQPANDDMETAPSSTVVPFPSPATAATAADSAVSVSAAHGAVASPTTSEGHLFSEADAKEDLIERLARGETPNQQMLADAWGVAKSTVSKWLDRWEEFERVGDTKPYQAKTVVRKGSLEAAA